MEEVLRVAGQIEENLTDQPVDSSVVIDTEPTAT
jgi:hypothetical protein